MLVLCVPLAAHEPAGTQATLIPAQDAAVPDLQLRLDKAEQRRFGVRTQLVAATPPTLSLPAQVIADPRRRFRLSAAQAGTVEAPPEGFVNAGSAVAAGQVLALLRPSLAEPQRRDVEAELALAQRDVELGQLQVRRYGVDLDQKFDIKLPTPSLQVVLDYRTAQTRATQYGAALSAAIPLRAPVDGVLLHSFVRRDAAVAAGETLFELSPRALNTVELQFSDQALDCAAAGLAETSTGEVLQLLFLGQAYDSQRHLQRAWYAVQTHADALAIGAPLQVQVPRLRAPQAQWLLPAAAVVADREGRSWVWLHRGAERFSLLAVVPVSAGEGWVYAAGALTGSDRVVIAGAALLQRRALRPAPQS